MEATSCSHINTNEHVFVFIVILLLQSHNTILAFCAYFYVMQSLMNV